MCDNYNCAPPPILHGCFPPCEVTIAYYMQEAKYWPESGMMRVGEFLVDCLHVKELTGFVIHILSLCPEKVRTLERELCIASSPSSAVRGGSPGVSDPCDLLDGKWSVFQTQSHC